MEKRIHYLNKKRTELIINQISSQKQIKLTEFNLLILGSVDGMPPFRNRYDIASISKSKIETMGKRD
jgi:hypothetical protein